MHILEDGHGSSSQLVAPMIQKSYFSQNWDQQESMPLYL
jgi:hypothetical protein